MRKLIVIVILAAVLYGGYWFVGKGQIQARMIDAIEQIDAGPADLTYSDLRTLGFPSRFDTTVTDLAYTDPVAGISWVAPTFQLFALSYAPNEVIAVFPNEQALTLGGEEFTIFTNDMRASGKVRANAALPFESATVTMDNPRIRSDEGAELAMANLLAAMRLTPQTDMTYDVFLEVGSVVLPEGIRAMIDPDNLQPPVIQSLRFDSDLDLTAPLALNSSDATADIARISIKEFALSWGQISLSIIGDLAPDAAGLLNGSVTLTARNWEDAIALAASSGLLPEEQRFLYTEIGRNLDETPHIDDTLTLTFTANDGAVAIGTFPLGDLPALR